MSKFRCIELEGLYKKGVSGWNPAKQSKQATWIVGERTEFSAYNEQSIQ